MKFERSDRNVGRRALKGAAFLAGARFTVRLFSLVNLVVLARLLAPEDYGIAALAFAALSMVQIFSDMRVTDGLMAIDRIGPEHLDTAFTMQMLRGLLTGALVFLFAEPIAQLMGAEELTEVMRVLALVLIVDGLKNPGYFMYQRNIDFSREFVRDTGAAVLASLCTIAAAVILRSYWALVIGTIVGRFLQTLLTYVRIPHRPGLTLVHWRQFIGFGAWLTFTGMLGQLNSFAPRFLIGRMISPAALGLFMVGRDTSALATQELVQPLRRTLFPSFSAIKDDKERLRRTILRANATLLAVALPIGFGIALLAREIVIILLGAKWLDAVIVLQILGPVQAVAMSVVAASSLMMALRKVRAMFLRTLIVTAVTWPALYFGIDLGGLTGAILAIAAATLVNMMINTFAIRTFSGLKVSSFLLSGWRSMISVAAMSAALLLLPNMTGGETDSLQMALITIPYVLAGAAVYTSVHMLLWQLSGRPDGPERYLIHYGGNLLSKLPKPALFASRGD